ncbi:MAG: hypothetical protein ACRELC_05665, partial [Gemmatimonadota bacterium]
MSDGTLLVILLIPMALALAFGIWAGLGYPGRFDKYEATGRAPRNRSPWWAFGPGRRRPSEAE